MSRQEIESTLASLASTGAFPELGRPDVAALLWLGAPLRVVWASPAAEHVAAALVVDGAGTAASSLPAADRLAALVGGRAPHDRTRLEKLRFETAAFAPLSTCACRLVTLPDGTPALATIFVDRLPRLRAAPRPVERAEAAPAAEAADVEMAAVPPPQSQPTAPEPEPEPALKSEPEPAVEEPAAPPAVIRFLWEADAEGRVTRVTPGLAEAVGTQAADVVGRRFADILADRARDPKDLVAELMARGETFSGRVLHWRVGDGDEAVAVELAGLPQLDRGRRIVGYRGFGLCRPQQRVAWDPHPVVPDRDEALAPPPWSIDAGPDLSDPLARLTPEPELEESGLAPGIAVEGPPDDAVADAPFAEEAATEEPAPDETARDAAANDERPSCGDGSETQHDDRGEVLTDKSSRDAAPSSAESPQDAPTAPARSGLTETERNAFREIAQALGAGRPAEAEPESAADGETAPEEAATDASDGDLETPSAPEGDAADNEAAAEPESAHDADLDDAVHEADADADELEQVILTPANDLAPDSRSVLDRLPAGVVIHRRERAIFVNRYLLDLLGYHDLDEFQRDGGLARLFRGRPGALEGTVEDSTAPLTIPTSAGETLAVEVRLTSVEWAGAPASMVMLRKVAEADAGQRLRAMELDLHAREESLREQAAILDTATDGVALLDQTGRILSLNRAAEALFGYDQREVAGEPFTLLLQMESHAAALGYIDAMRSEGLGALLNDGREVLGRERQGGAIPLFMTLGLIGGGRERKFCVVLRDMTAFKQAEGELIAARRAAERASAQKSDFLATISHEIRTPLNAIIGFAEVMLEERFGPVGNERYRDYVADIHASGAHVISLVNDLLDLAKIEAGRMELTFAPVNLNELVASCVALLQPQATRDRIVLRTSFGENVPRVEADERALRQIVLNLLSNAVKFTEPGGQVIVSTAVSGSGEVVFRVRDTGIGMNEAEIETALEPFRQLATSRRGGGTGLGLPLTKALVEANRGALKISSRRDEGTLVEVALPQVAPALR